ncbi:hypothetical protein U9M48_042737 [Paspalum notatum var. saurae]|uniref:Uncharacterized protein n=1 Tax=Paspalum notatum var. saurae TaxID=547442 RepID=A0AAQ3URF4_PASNO
MGDSKPMTTPMSTNTALDADEDGEAVDQKIISRDDRLTSVPDGDQAGHSVRGLPLLQVEGVDNALIKGGIESQWTGHIALLV